MDRKSILVLTLCAILFMAWAVITPRLYPPAPISRTNTFASVTNLSGSGTNSASALLRATSTNLAGAIIAPGAPEELLVLTNDQVRYTFTSYGGGLKQVELLNYPESVACNSKGAAAGRVAAFNTQAGQPVLGLLNASSWQGDGVYKLSRMGAGVRLEKALENGLYLVKEFAAGSNYLMQARVRLENRSAKDFLLPAQQWSVGTAAPLNAHDDGALVGLYWYDGTSEQRVDRSYFDNRFLGCFPGTPRAEYRMAPGKITWAAADNQFFFLALMPKQPAQDVMATLVHLPVPSAAELAADPTARTNQVAIQVSLQHSATNLPAGLALEHQFTLFAGPKEFHTIEQLGVQLKNNLDRVMGYSGFWGFFPRLLLLAMNGLHSLGLSYALAIITITIIVKLLFWPLTQASTRSMKRMQALQPQIKALQERYKAEPEKMQKKMMEFWREHKINPMGGCLPMLLQVPVFIGFFKMVQSAIELRGATFLWACDLSKSDTVYVVPGFNFPINPLPLIMGVTMFWQARVQPMSPGMDPAQQKIMKYFPLLFLVMLYNYSAGLTLYWTVQNLLTIAQMKLTNAKDQPAAVPVPVTAPKKKK